MSENNPANREFIFTIIDTLNSSLECLFINFSLTQSFVSLKFPLLELECK